MTRLSQTARNMWRGDTELKSDKDLSQSGIIIIARNDRRMNMRKMTIKKGLMSLLCGIAAIGIVCSMSGCSKKDKEETVALSPTDSSKTETKEAEEAAVIEDTPADPSNETDSTEEYFVQEPVMKYGTVTGVNADEYSITIDTVYEKTGEKDSSASDSETIIFNAAEYVPVIDAATGEAIELKDVQEGSYVYAWAGDTMTLSLPAQMSLQALVTNIPADAAAPVYAVVKGIDWSKDDMTLTINTTDGTKWYATNGKTEVKPFRTKQTVKLYDIKPGSRLMLWGLSAKDASDGELSKVMILSSAD